MSSKSVMVVFEDNQRFGETTFFFNNDQVITNIDGNDGNYRDEYFNCLFNSFHVKVKRVNKLTKKQEINLTSYCREQNIKECEAEATEENHDYFSIRLRSPYDYQDLSFVIHKNLSNAQWFLDLYKQMGDYPDFVNYYFTEVALEISSPSAAGNYLTNNGSLGECNLVEEIHREDQVTSEADFYNYTRKAKCFRLKQIS